MTTPTNPTRKPVQCWIVYDHDGEPILWALGYTRRSAILTYLREHGEKIWSGLYRLGYRCRKVAIPRITP